MIFIDVFLLFYKISFSFSKTLRFSRSFRFPDSFSVIMPKISFIAAALVTYSKQQSAILGSLGRPGCYAASLADETYKSEIILKENI